MMDVNNVNTPTPRPTPSSENASNDDPVCEWWCILLIVLGILLCLSIGCLILYCMLYDLRPPPPPPPPPIYGDCPAEGACEDASPLIAPTGPVCDPGVELYKTPDAGYGQTVPGYGQTNPGVYPPMPRPT